MGQLNMDYAVDSPFRAMDALLKREAADIFVVDFHGEATSEKKAFGYSVAGKVAVVFGTHTHVPTADEQVLPGGTGFISDLGMTGGVASVIGVKWQQSLDFFTGGLGQRFQSSNEDLRIQGAVFTLDAQGKCTEVKRVEYR
jgi:calcineurin-like phosphoesterase